MTSTKYQVPSTKYPGRTTWWFFVLCTLYLVLSTPCCVASGPKDGSRFTIETPAETRTGCILHALDETAIHVDDAGVRVKLPKWIELRRDGALLPALPTRDFLLLTTGDRIPLDPNTGALFEENRLRVWPAKSAFPELHAKGFSVYGPNVFALFWTVPDGVDDADLYFKMLQGELRKRDVAYLKNGDRIEGTLTALDGKTGCELKVGEKNIRVPWSKLAGLAWNTERAVRPKTKKPYARAVLAGGARVSFAELRYDGAARRWTGKTLFGAAIDFPCESLTALDMHQDLAVDLSALTPVRYDQRPFLGDFALQGTDAPWPLGKNTAVTGQPLRLGGNTYEKGLGTHAISTVTYNLDGQYQRFDALVGIDEMARRGRAKVALVLDGKRIALNDGKEITHKDAPLLVRQDVRKVRELTLIVELGAFGDVQAHVNWAKARLIK